jgi:hypothetical protein
MAVNFPNSPIDGQIVTVANKKYRYVASKNSWEAVNFTASGVIAGTYGSSTTVPVITVNENGIVTSATTVSSTNQSDIIAFAIALGG